MTFCIYYILDNYYFEYWFKGLSCNIHMTEKRCNVCKIEIDCKYKTCVVCRENNRLRFWNLSPEERERRRGCHALRYRTDAAWRAQKKMEVTVRAKANVVCSECDKTLKYGSMNAHKKCRRGRIEKTTLQQLLELSLGLKRV